MKALTAYIAAFFKWFGIAILVGVTAGGVSASFHVATEWAGRLRGGHPWLLYLMPVGGAIIVLLYKLFRNSDDKGTNTVLSAITGGERVPFYIMPLIYISTVITHLVGGSSGREGAALQIGGSIADKIGELLRLDEKDMHLITMCGMSAAFSALFGTPVTAAVFSMEVISVGIMHYSGLVPCVVSAVTGFLLSRLLGIEATHFEISYIPDITLITLLRTVVLAALCALLSIGFCAAFKYAGLMYKKLLPNMYLRVLAGSAAIILLTVAVGNTDYNGTGMSVIRQAFTGRVFIGAFALKIIFTALTLGAGFKGGEIVPTFFAGATFGNVAGGLLGLNSSFGAGVGLITLFCGVTNCPITSIALSVELFGAQGVLYFALACAVGYMLSGRAGLYSAQRIVYSKLKAEFIGGRK